MIKEKSMFFKEDKNSWEPAGEGITRQITGYNDHLMMVKVKFEKGAIGQVHNHLHTQSSYVASGNFKITIEAKSENLQAGDAFFVPPNANHGAECLQAGVLIDVFTPLREDFLKDEN